MNEFDYVLVRRQWFLHKNNRDATNSLEDAKTYKTWQAAEMRCQDTNWKFTQIIDLIEASVSNNEVNHMKTIAQFLTLFFFTHALLLTIDPSTHFETASMIGAIVAFLPVSGWLRWPTLPNVAGLIQRHQHETTVVLVATSIEAANEILNHAERNGWNVGIA